jgi:hypothetical protein
VRRRPARVVVLLAVATVIESAIQSPELHGGSSSFVDGKQVCMCREATGFPPVASRHTLSFLPLSGCYEVKLTVPLWVAPFTTRL